MTPTLFISDLHLAAERPATVAGFLGFLAGVETGTRLFCLGDLFDVWIGDDDPRPPVPEVQAALRSATARGVQVFLMHGNRDFLVGSEFCRATGCEAIPDPYRIELGGEPVLLMHGDLLCTGDARYQAFRGQVRQPATIAGFLARPLVERAAIAAEMRRQSGEANSLKAEEIMDVAPETVRAYMEGQGVGTLIHGHTHRPGRQEWAEGSRTLTRWVLPEWSDAGGGALRHDAEGLRAVAVPFAQPT